MLLRATAEVPTQLGIETGSAEASITHPTVARVLDAGPRVSTATAAAPASRQLRGKRFVWCPIRNAGVVMIGCPCSPSSATAPLQ